MSENRIGLDQLKNLYNTTTESPDSLIELCYSGKEVYVKPLKVIDKKDLLKAIESKNEDIVNKKLDDLIIKYVEAKDGHLDFDELTSNERHQIMVYIRVAAGGNTAKIVHQCPNCESVNKNIEYDLENLHIKEYDRNEINPFIPIGNGDIEVEVCPLTRSVEKQVERYIKNNKIKTVTERQMSMVASHIKNVWVKDVSGEKDYVEFKNLEERIKFFFDLTGSDSNKIIDFISEKLDFGVKMPFKFVCESCGFESEEEVNVAAFFIS